MNLKELISVDPDVLGGQTVFKGTRVPIESMFDHLEAGVSLNSFLEDFPSVSREQAIALLDWTNRLLSSTKNIQDLYEVVT